MTNLSDSPCSFRAPQQTRRCSHISSQVCHCEKQNGYKSILQPTHSLLFTWLCNWLSKWHWEASWAHPRSSDSDALSRPLGVWYQHARHPSVSDWDVVDCLLTRIGKHVASIRDTLRRSASEFGINNIYGFESVSLSYFVGPIHHPNLCPIVTWIGCIKVI